MTQLFRQRSSATSVMSSLQEDETRNQDLDPRLQVLTISSKIVLHDPFLITLKVYESIYLCAYVQLEDILEKRDEFFFKQILQEKKLNSFEKYFAL